MKKLIYFIFLIGICFGSCDKQNNSANEGQKEKSTISEQSTKESLNNEADTKSKAMVDSIISIKSDVEQIKKHIESNKSKISEIDDNKERIQKLETSYVHKCFWILIVLCICCLITSCIIVILQNKDIKLLKKKNHDLNNEIKKCHGFIEDINKKLGGNYTSKPNDKTTELNKRLDSIDAEIKKLKKQFAPNTNINPGIADTRNDINYFGEVVEKEQGYFRKLLESNTDDAMFRCEIHGNMATFEPISWDKIKSNDNALYVVEYSGVAPREATYMRVSSRGEAKFIDNKWIVTKKILIQLS